MPKSASVGPTGTPVPSMIAVSFGAPLTVIRDGSVPERVSLTLSWYVPARTQTTAPGLAAACAWEIVWNGADDDPAFVSAPVGDTKLVQSASDNRAVAELVGDGARPPGAGRGVRSAKVSGVVVALSADGGGWAADVRSPDVPGNVLGREPQSQLQFDIAPADTGTRRMMRHAHATTARRAIRARARLRAWSTAARLPRRTAELDSSRPPSTRRRCRRSGRNFLRINRPCRDPRLRRSAREASYRLEISEYPCAYPGVRYAHGIVLPGSAC